MLGPCAQVDDTHTAKAGREACSRAGYLQGPRCKQTWWFAHLKAHNMPRGLEPKRATCNKQVATQRTSLKEMHEQQMLKSSINSSSAS